MLMMRSFRFCAGVFAALAIGGWAAESQPATPTETSVQKPAGPLKRTRTEVDALIEKEGMTPPGWWDEVTLNVPPDLDLTWANPTQGQNQNKFLMCYIWNVINTNPGKWKEGAKLLAQTLKVNKNDPAKLKLSMNALGKMYHDFFRTTHARRTGGRRRAAPGAATSRRDWRIATTGWATKKWRQKSCRKSSATMPGILRGSGRTSASTTKRWA
jgi:hypothetical protein